MTPHGWQVPYMAEVSIIFSLHVLSAPLMYRIALDVKEKTAVDSALDDECSATPEEKPMSTGNMEGRDQDVQPAMNK